MKESLKKALIISALAVGAVATAAFAFDPQTDPTQWTQMLQKSLKLQTFQGQPWIMAINATPDEITVTCDGKWTMVGPEPYKTLKGNPVSLQPWSITPIHATSDFEGYCSKLIGQGNFNSYNGVLNGGATNFNNSTLLMFVAPKA